MSRRMIAAVVAAPLVAVLLVLASFAPLPYVTYRPGGTLDVLGNGDNGQEIIQVEGHKTYRDDGQPDDHGHREPAEAGEQPARADGHLDQR